MGIFVMGSILGAGVAISYFGDVAKIRAQIESYVVPEAKSGSGAHLPPPLADGGPAPALATAPDAPDAALTAPAASALDVDLDGGFDDDGGEDDDDDDDLDDAGQLIAGDAAGGSPLAKPAGPKKRPKPAHPARPHRRRHRRR